MVARAGIEPATFRFSVRRQTRFPSSANYAQYR
ncbi:Uncharacterised protein [Mycobacteroides abscessus subsp. abscessus]|nr:Uncharacterised protein [Mycobacteroides abscessus subsp. abscessus]